MKIKIQKNTENDLTAALSKALKEHNKGDYSWYMDRTEDKVIYEVTIYSNNDYEYKTLMASFSYDGVTATIGDDAVEVVRQTEYKVVDTDSKIEKAVAKYLKKFLPNKTPVLKSIDEMEMKSIEQLYVLPESPDLVGDTLTKEDNEAMVESFNKANAEGKVASNLFHKVEAVNKDGLKLFHYTKAFILEEDTEFDGVVVPEGLALVEVQWNCEKTFQMRMNGKLGAPSIGVLANVEYVDE